MAIQSQSSETQTSEIQPAQIQPADNSVVYNPNQFGLSDLFALVTLASMLCAIFVPVARAMLAGQGFVAVIFLIIESGLVGACGYWVVKQRTRCIQLAGTKLGSGFCGVVRWRYWPKLISWTLMLLIASFQLGLSLLIASFPLILVSIHILMVQCQLAFFTARAFLCFWSRVYPNSIEFFERGIVLYGTWFIPWDQMTVRPSTLFPDRIVVVYQLDPKRPSGNLCVVQVTEQLRKSVFAASQAK